MKFKLFNKGRKGFSILLIIFSVLIALDLYTTLSLGELAAYLEINPVYKYGGFLGILALNVLFIVGLYFYYNWKKTKPYLRYILIMVLVIGCLFRLFIVCNNLIVQENPPTLEEAQQITDEQRTEYFKLFLSTNFFKLLIPFMIGILTYWFFRTDHLIERKKEDKIKWQD